MVGRKVEIEGPTGLIVTTTKDGLIAENETRLLSVFVSDSRAQTKAIMLAQARGKEQALDLAEWVALNTWLAREDPRVDEEPVDVPFAEALADVIEPVDVRLRRDFVVLLRLIRAHALLHQESRERNSDEQVVATFEDYEVIRDLVAEPMSAMVGVTVSDAMRETVKAVAELSGEDAKEVSQAELTGKLELNKSTVSRRVTSGIRAGHLLNREEKRGKPARIVVGEPLPDEEQLLPDVETLKATVESLEAECCSVAVNSGDTPSSTSGDDREAS